MAYPQYSPPGAYPPGPSAGHTRVTYSRRPNFLERVGGSMCGAVVGAVLIASACFLLFLNEGRSVHTYNMLVESRDLCHPIKSPDLVYDSLENKLIYLSGHLSTSGPVADDTYGVSGRYVRLRRKVDMYQWVEETETREYEERDGTVRNERTYKYSTMWQSDVIDSNSFDDPRLHHNPRSMPVSSMGWIADRASVGQYELSKDAVSEIYPWHTVRLRTDGEYKRGVRVYGNELYHGDPHQPQVGDVRVYYEYAGRAEEGNAETVSAVGRQAPGPMLNTFTTQSGYKVLFLYMELLSMDEVFDHEHASNQALMWGLRVLGWFLTIIGINMVAGILTTLVDWIPLLREVVSFSVLLLSIALGSSLSLVVIAIAWLRYRPLYALTILLISISPFIASRFFSRKKTGQDNKHY